MKKNEDLIIKLFELKNSQKGITLITEEKQKIFVSYGQLWLRSGYVAEQLKKMGAMKGSEVFIRCENLEYFLYAFWGCVQNLCVAIPIESTNKKYGNEMMQFVMKKLDDAYMLYDHDGCMVNENIHSLDLRGEIQNIYAYDEVFDVPEASSLEDIVYIIYSSGTTGEPNGVVIRKYNIAANVQGFVEHYNITEDDRFLSWSPLTHCYGLITFHMVPLLQGASHCLLSSKLYMQSPLTWLDMADEYKATRIGSLPFALRHFVNVFNKKNHNPGWDLSCVKSMFIGGEQVNAPLCREFADISENYNLSYNKIYPLYGLSEATIMCTANPQGAVVQSYVLDSASLVIGSKITCKVASESESKDAFLEMGTALSTVELKICDENDVDLLQEHLGHVFISGPCITTGYYKNQEATERVIREGNWLYTGDVGFIHNNSLIIVGREKELVVANGKKFACITVENIINSVDKSNPFGSGIICNGNSVKSEAEKVILFYEIPLDLNDKRVVEKFIHFGEKVKAAVFEKIGLTINEILPIREFPRTFSGKIFRRELTQNYNEGIYSEVMKVINEMDNKKDHMDILNNQKVEYSRELISTKISEIISELFYIQIKNYDTPFTECGIISINIPPFIERVNQDFQVEIPISSIFSYTNITKLAEHIYNCIYKKEKEVVIQVKDEQEDDKIAIVGMSCRFPAGSDNIDEFWEALVTGRDGIVDIPSSRWDVEKYYSENENQPGKMYCRKGGFLDCDVNAFDAGLFNVSPQEAQNLDPQQRLLLELVWEAFENAGMDITKYYGSETGVYLGISSNEYSLAGIYSGDLNAIGQYSLTGGSFSTICGRVSYLFGFEGPCFSVDTACSSSLTALHLACNAVKAGEADMAVVAGVNLMLSPVVHVAFSKLHATSEDGTSKAFDESANGYGRAEGGGVLLIKKLSDAVKDKDEILGVICGTGINQDGRSNGLTAPNGASQAKLMKKTLQKAFLKPDDIDYIEMHGTGTPLGDPIEVNAVADVFGVGRTSPLRIGSVKSNIGHLEPVSGIASVIKVLLSLKHGVIPANLHFNKPNSFIQWDKIPVEVVGTESQWPKSDKVRRAGINGFGFGGSNAHVIIEDYCGNEKAETQEAAASTESGLDYILKISAKSEKSLRDYMFKYVKSLEECRDEEFIDFLYTANRGRVDFNYRVAVTAKDRMDMADKLKALLIGGAPAGVFYNYNKHSAFIKNRKVVMMFAGQGSQYLDMGRKLFETNPVFRESMTLCDKMFRAFLLKSILQMLYKEGDGELIERTVYAQPLIFTINYALYKVWEDLGVKPEIVTGHSIGEYVAAVATGIVSLEDAIKMVAIRGRFMDSAPGKGAMGTVFADADTLNGLLQGYEESVCIATHNGKDNYVVAGNSDAVEEILVKAEGMGIHVKRLKVSHAFHSILMEPILEDFREFICDITFHKAQGRYLSCLYARELTNTDTLDADYWTRHIRERVSFYEAIDSIEHKEEYVFLEVGSARVLSALCRMNLSEGNLISATLKRGIDDSAHLACTIAELYVSGVTIDWFTVKFFGQESFRHIYLPNYPYDKGIYGMSLQYDRSGDQEAVSKVHPLLGERIESPLLDNVVIFQRKFKADEPFFMSEHVIFEVPISPAAAHISFILSAVREVKKPVSCTIKSVEFRIPLAVTDDEERIVQVCLTEIDNENLDFEIVSRDSEADTEWQIHATGKVEVNYSRKETEKAYSYDEIDTWVQNEVAPEDGTYRLMRETGFHLGDGFRRITKVAHAAGSMEEYVSEIEPLEAIPNREDYVLYPGTIDSIFQTGTYKEVAKRIQNAELVVDPEKDENMIPYYMEEFTYNCIDAGKMSAYTSIIGTDHNFITFNVDVFNENHELVLKLRKMMAKVTNRKDLLQGVQNIHMPYFYCPTWEVKNNANKLSQTKAPEKYIVVADHFKEAAPFVDAFHKYAIDVEVVLNGEGAGTKENIFFINQNEEQSFKQFVNEAVEKSADKKVVFVYCNGCDSGQADSKQLDFTVSDAPLKRLLYLVKAMIKSGAAQKLGLKIITKNAEVPEGEEVCNLEQAAIWGLSKVLGIELSSIYEGILDIGNESLTEAGFVSEVVDKTADEVCFANGKRYVQRVVKVSLGKKAGQDSIQVKKDGSYLITGGTGAVGMVYADTLVKLGAKKLLLCCRKHPREYVSEKMEEYRNSGVQVELVMADVSSKGQLEDAIKLIPEKMLPICGIVHGAGVLEDRMLNEQTWESFKKVLEPKVTGLLNVIANVDTEKLDFVIMISSITSIIGNLGQSNYAAANYFMNQYAIYLRSFGIPAYAMCWGPWETGGMANSSEDIGRNMNAMGLSALSNETSQLLIMQFMEKPENKLMLADIDWKKMSSSLKGNRQTALLERLLQKYIQHSEDSKEADHLYETLSRINSKEERIDYVCSVLQKICGSIMGFSNSDQLDVNSSLSEQGADSLIMFTMRSAINKAFKSEIEVSTFYNYPTLVKLSGYLVNDILFAGVEETETVEPEPNLEEVLDEIGKLLD